MKSTSVQMDGDIKKEFDVLLNDIDSVEPFLNEDLDDIRTDLSYEGLRLI